MNCNSGKTKCHRSRWCACQRHLRLPMPLVIQFPVNPSSWLDARGDGKVEWCGGSQAAVGIFLGMKQWQECHRFFGYFWAMSKKHWFSRIGKMPRKSDGNFGMEFPQGNGFVSGHFSLLARAEWLNKCLQCGCLKKMPFLDFVRYFLCCVRQWFLSQNLFLMCINSATILLPSCPSDSWFLLNSLEVRRDVWNCWLFG